MYSNLCLDGTREIWKISILNRLIYYFWSVKDRTSRFVCRVNGNKNFFTPREKNVGKCARLESKERKHVESQTSKCGAEDGLNSTQMKSCD